MMSKTDAIENSQKRIWWTFYYRDMFEPNFGFGTEKQARTVRHWLNTFEPTGNPEVNWSYRPANEEEASALTEGDYGGIVGWDFDSTMGDLEEKYWEALSEPDVEDA